MVEDVAERPFPMFQIADRFLVRPLLPWRGLTREHAVIDVPLQIACAGAWGVVIAARQQVAMLLAHGDGGDGNLPKPQ